MVSACIILLFVKILYYSFFSPYLVLVECRIWLCQFFIIVFCVTTVIYNESILWYHFSDFVISHIILYHLLLCDITYYYVMSQISILLYHKIALVKSLNKLCEIKSGYDCVMSLIRFVILLLRLCDVTYSNFVISVFNIFLFSYISIDRFCNITKNGIVVSKIYLSYHFIKSDIAK